MLEREGEPMVPAGVGPDPPPNGPSGDTAAVESPPGPAYLPFSAYPEPSALLPPQPPTWRNTYELPSARRVISAGLQLALSTTSDLRRGSIYIGLLMLAASAPVLGIIVVSLLGTGPRPDHLFGLVFADQAFLTMIDPNVAMLALTVDAAIVLVAILAIAISIDAQAIAIALLAGRATGRPLRLWEALGRARQVFWRLAGASLLLGIPAVIVSILVGFVLNRPNGSPEATDVVSQLVSALLLAPLGYVSAGIVIGDVGVIEAARRSVRLFRARPRIGLVVVLFPLVASAIEIFALLAGLDLVGRVVEALHLDALAGGEGAVIGVGLLVLAIVAFGSLLFTIGAIVSAPQVAAFLGLTLFAAGIDKARIDGPRPGRTRWMTRRMAVTIGVATPLLVMMVVGTGSTVRDLPDVGGLPGGDPVAGSSSSLVEFLDEHAAEHHQYVSTDAAPFTWPDDPGDVLGSENGSADLVYVEFATVASVPSWLIEDVFDCNLEDVVCNERMAPAVTWSKGVLMVLIRTTHPTLNVDPGFHGEWGVVFALSAEEPAPADPDDPISAASHAIVIRTDEEGTRIGSQSWQRGALKDNDTYTRAIWLDNQLIVMIPVVGEVEKRPVFWDAYARLTSAAGVVVSRDTTRMTRDGRGLHAYLRPPVATFVDQP